MATRTYPRHSMKNFNHPAKHYHTMKRFIKIIMTLMAITIASLIIWLSYPPFPHPDTLIDQSYSSLTRQLGPPTDNPGEKFITWSIKRMEVAVWFIEVGVDFPLKQNTHPPFIRREFWVLEHRVFQQIAFRHPQTIDPDPHKERN